MIQRQGFDSVVIGNGVDIADALRPRERPPEFHTERSVFRLVMVGSVIEIKGVANAIRALSLVLEPDRRDRIELFFVGKGDPQRYLALAGEIGVRMQVHFLGARQDVFPYMQHADLLLCLSGGGGMSMAALESLASGVPVLAWDTPVYRQLITDGKNGWLVSSQADGALAAAFIRAMETPIAERQQMGRCATESVRAHDWERVVDHVETRLCKLCGVEPARVMDSREPAI